MKEIELRELLTEIVLEIEMLVLEVQLGKKIFAALFVVVEIMTVLRVPKIITETTDVEIEDSVFKQKLRTH